jgi:hypothetical protein
MKGHDARSRRRAKLDSAMQEFGILTNRKRALIALAYSIVFLGVALHGFASPRAAITLHGPGAPLGITLIRVYLTVASILAYLVRISRCSIERLYFGFSASSATFGLLRTVFGDSALPAAQYLRVLMLASAVAVGVWVHRSLSRAVAETVLLPLGK